MIYLDKSELRRLLLVAIKHDKRHHLALLVSFLHGLRVSEVLSLRGADVTVDGKLIVTRLKRSKATEHTLRHDPDPLLDESPLISYAGSDERLFPWNRQYMDRLIKKYGVEAGLHPTKCHHHALKHGVCMALFQETKDLNAIQDHVGHRSTSSTLVYLRAAGAQKAQRAMETLAI